MMNEDKAARYHRLRRRAVVLAWAWRVSLLAFLVISGLGASLRDWAAAAVQPFPAFLQFPMTVLAWVTAVVLLHDLGALPMAFFAGSVIEKRYGLSRQPAFSWLRDHVKGAAVGLSFVGAAAAWTYSWIAVAPQLWWLPAWAGMAAADVVTTWGAAIPSLMDAGGGSYAPSRDAVITAGNVGARRRRSLGGGGHGSTANRRRRQVQCRGRASRGVPARGRAGMGRTVPIGSPNGRLRPM